MVSELETRQIPLAAGGVLGVSPWLLFMAQNALPESPALWRSPRLVITVPTVWRSYYAFPWYISGLGA
jgi:hypothetical protein